MLFLKSPLPRAAFIIGGFIGIALCAWIAFYPALFGEFFISDSKVYVVTNQRLHDTPLIESWRFFSEPGTDFDNQPLRDISLLIDYKLFGPTAPPYRLHNYILFLISAIGVGWAAREWILTFAPKLGEKAIIVALFAAAIWALHPLHIETVPWISGRKDVLAGAFGFVCFAVFLRSLRLPFSYLRTGISAFLFAGALLSKAVVLPLMIVCALCACVEHFHHRRSSLGEVIKKVAPLFVVGGLDLLRQLHHLTTNVAPTEVLGTTDPTVLERSVIAFKILGHLLIKWIAPLGFDMSVKITPIPADDWLPLFVGIALTIAAGIGFFCFWRFRSIWGFGALFFLGMSATVLQFIPYPTWSMVADRLLFWPSFGIALLIAAKLTQLADQGGKPRLLAVGLLCLWTLVCLKETADRSQLWGQGEIALFAHNWERNPDNINAAIAYIGVLLNDDYNFSKALKVAQSLPDDEQKLVIMILSNWEKIVRDVKAHQVDFYKSTLELRAIAQQFSDASTSKAWHKTPTYASALKKIRNFINLQWKQLSVVPGAPGWVWAERGVFLQDYYGTPQKEAVSSFERALQDNSLDQQARVSIYDRLASLYRSHGDLAQAKHYWQIAMELDPTSHIAPYNLLSVYVIEGDQDNIKRLSEIFRRNARAHGLSQAQIEGLLKQRLGSK